MEGKRNTKLKHCVDCGIPIDYRAFRCHKCRSGEKHSQWKGGKAFNGEGYVLIRAVGHHRASKLGQYVREHDLVMEKHLGRYLKTNEIVHHKNGIKTDNRIENLELMTRSAHMKIHPKIRDNRGRFTK